MSENCNLIANRGLPHINEHIFSFLDDWSLTQIRGVCQDWKEFVDVHYSKFFYQRLRKRCENNEQFLNNCAMEGFLYVFQVFTRNFEKISEINPRDDEGRVIYPNYYTSCITKFIFDTQKCSSNFVFSHEKLKNTKL